MTTNVSDFKEHLRILQALPSVEDSEPHDLALREILRFLMSHEGYIVHRSGIDGFDEQIHLWAIQEKAIEIQGPLTLAFPLDRTPDTLGIHRSSSPIRLTPDDYALRVFLGGLPMLCYERGIIFAPSGFTDEMANFARDYYPATLELIDLARLNKWIGEKFSPIKDLDIEIRTILRETSKSLLRSVAGDVDKLQKVEWRDLERMLAEAFNSFGFSVELTPSSKDDGRDIILRYSINGKRQKYFVEVKHWRCGNRVGAEVALDFIKVVVGANANGGMIISTSGFTENFGSSLTEIEKKIVKFEGREKILSLAKNYVQMRDGIYLADGDFATVLGT